MLSERPTADVRISFSVGKQDRTFSVSVPNVVTSSSVLHRVVASALSERAATQEEGFCETKKRKVFNFSWLF